MPVIVRFGNVDCSHSVFDRRPATSGTEFVGHALIFFVQGALQIALADARIAQRLVCGVLLGAAAQASLQGSADERTVETKRVGVFR